MMAKIHTTVHDRVLVVEFTSNLEIISCLDTFIVLYESKYLLDGVGCYFPVTSANKWFRDTNGRVKNDCQKTFMEMVIKHSNKCVYVVAFVRGKVKVKQHCLRNARFYTDYKYRKLVEHVWLSLNDEIRNRIICILDGMGYPNEVWIDEFQAHITTERTGFFGCKNEKQLFSLMVKL
jgi:hypothetical protein